jgi:hypothetical protein
MPGVRLEMKAVPIMAQTGYMTLASAVDGLASSGFREHFRIKSGKLQALDSGETFNAPELLIRAYHRFEGVSDPDDMAVIYAIESRDGVRGTLVDAFGVYADPAVGRFLDGVAIREVSQFGAAETAQPRAHDRPESARTRRPVREPFVFGPRNHPAMVRPLAATTSRTARYDYGFPAPASGDPWQDDGGGD